MDQIEVIRQATKDNIRRYLDRINKIDLEYEKKIDKLIDERDKEIQIWFEMVSIEQKKLQEVK